MFSKKKKSEEEYQDTTDQAVEASTDLIDLDEEDLTPKKKKLPGWIIFPVIGLIAVVAVIGQKVAGGSKNASAGSSLKVAAVENGDVKEVFNSNGTITSGNTKTYYSPVTAPVSSCNAVLGQPVKNGDLLITYDTTTLERDNQQSQLSLQASLNSSQSTRAQNAKAIDAANAASADLANSANNLADQSNALAEQVNNELAAVESRRQEVAPVNAQRAQKRAQLEQEIAALNATISQSNDTINRIQADYGTDRSELDIAISENNQTVIDALSSVFKELDDARQTLKDATAAKAAAEAQLAANADESVDTSALESLQAEYAATYAAWEAAYAAANSGSAPDVGMTGTELQGLNISDNLAELAALTPAELVAKGKEGIKADMDGVVAAVEAVVGADAVQGGAMVTVASTNDVRVSIEVSPDDYDKLRVGNKATITIAGSKYNGTLTKINKIAINNAKGNPVIGAEVKIDNPDENICIGATAKVSMTIAEADNVLVVPTEAINTSSDGDFVYVIEKGVVTSKPIELGTSSTSLIEVTKGLKKGDKVVTDMNVDIKEGMSATAVEDSTDAASAE